MFCSIGRLLLEVAGSNFVWVWCWINWFWLFIRPKLKDPEDAGWIISEVCGVGITFEGTEFKRGKALKNSFLANCSLFSVMVLIDGCCFCGIGCWDGSNGWLKGPLKPFNWWFEKLVGWKLCLFGIMPNLCWCCWMSLRICPCCWGDSCCILRSMLGAKFCNKKVTVVQWILIYLKYSFYFVLYGLYTIN